MLFFKHQILQTSPRFEDWNLIKAQALITGKVNFVDEKLLNLDYGTC